MITIEQLKDVQQRADKLKAYLQIDEKRIQLEEEELHTQAPGFWDDAKAAEAQMRKVKGIKRWIEGYEGVRAAVEELALAFDYYKEELVTEEEVDAAYAHALTEVEDLPFAEYTKRMEEQDVILDQAYSYTPAMNALQVKANLIEVVVESGLVIGK